MELDENGREVELGKGAFGVVVKGRYRLSPVAIKRLIDQSPEQQRQFVKEMAILRACRGSRYIVPFVGASLQPVRPRPLTVYHKGSLSHNFLLDESALAECAGSISEKKHLGNGPHAAQQPVGARCLACLAYHPARRRVAHSCNVELDLGWPRL